MGSFNILVELLKPGELRGEAALGGGVDDEDNFALELGEIVDFAALCIAQREAEVS